MSNDNLKEAIQLPTPPNSQLELDNEVVDQMPSIRLSPNATDSGDAVITSTAGDAAADARNIDPDFLMKLVQDSVKYLSAVKERLNVEDPAHPDSENAPKYEQFLAVFKDLKDRKIDACTTTSRILEILKGHDDLIEGFAMFIPPSFEMSAPTDAI